jgi:hypothetical protein
MNTLGIGRFALLCAALFGQVGCATTPAGIAGDWRPVLDACPAMPPLLPLASLPGTTRVDLTAELRNDRIVRSEMRYVQGIADRRAQRIAISTIESTLAKARCPGVSKLRVEVVLGPQQAGFQNVQLER